MKRSNKIPKSRRAFSCPQCGKQRMTRDPDHEISLKKQEYKTANGGTIELYVDICDWCKQRNSRKHFEASRTEMARILKALHEDAKLDGDQSLEDFL